MIPTSAFPVFDILPGSFPSYSLILAWKDASESFTPFFFLLLTSLNLLEDAIDASHPHVDFLISCILHI